MPRAYPSLPERSVGDRRFQPIDSTSDSVTDSQTLGDHGRTVRFRTALRGSVYGCGNVRRVRYGLRTSARHLPMQTVHWRVSWLPAWMGGRRMSPLILVAL